jgi:hypothetical protein
LIVIQTAEIYAGQMPRKQLKLVFEWLSENSDWALDVFFQLNPNLR